MNCASASGSTIDPGARTGLAMLSVTTNSQCGPVGSGLEVDRVTLRGASASASSAGTRPSEARSRG